MNRREYLEVKSVDAFAGYIAEALRGKITVNEFWSNAEPRHGRKPAGGWTLEALFLGYRWRGKILSAITRNLRPVRKALKGACNQTVSNAELIKALSKGLDWGLDKQAASANVKWARECGDELPELYKCAVATLNSDTPDLSIFRRARINSGYVKPYSLAADNSVNL